MDLTPTDFLSGLGGLGNLPHPYEDQQQVTQDQQQNAAGKQQLALGALKLGAIQQQQQQAQQYQADVADAIKTGRFGALYAKYPEQQKELQAAHDALDEPSRRATERDLFAVSSYIKAGAVDSAKSLLQKRVEADKAAGLPVDDDQQMLDALNNGDPSHVKAAADMALYAILPADKRAEIFTKSGQDEQYTLAPGSKRYDATGHLIAEAPFAPEYRNVGAGDTLVQVGGGGQASGGGASSGALSVRLNNPGAIRFDPSNDWQGQVGQENGFVKFATPEAGAAAHRKLIGNQIKAGFDTPLTWAQHYAPATDGNDPQAYAQTVARGLGIGINDKIPLGAVPKVAALSASVEAGGTPAPRGGAQVVATGAPKPGYTMLTPQEKASIPGLDPNTVYQRAPDGQITAVGGQSKNQLKPWPVNALTSRATNNAALTNITGALDLLTGKTPEAKAAQNALGISNNLPNRFNNWNDPAGIDFRARIGQIGGIIIKDTSGAAVSLSEDERLSKWVPKVTDSPATARAKLANLKRELAQRNEALDESFSEDQGYRPFHASGAAATGPAVQIKTTAEWAKLPKGTPYVDPKGVRRVKS